MKKTFAAIILAFVLTASLPLAAYAEDTSSASPAASSTISTSAATSSSASGSRYDNRMAMLKQRQDKLAERMAEVESRCAALKTKMEQYKALRAGLTEKRIGMLNFRGDNISAMQQNNQLCTEIAKAIKAIKDSGTKLSDDTLAKIKDYKSQIAALTDGLKQTKGQIKEIMKTNKENMKNKDYKAIQAAFDQIYTIQQWRNEQLKTINGLLQNILTLLTGSGTSSTAATSTTSSNT